MPCAIARMAFGVASEPVPAVAGINNEPIRRCGCSPASRIISPVLLPDYVALLPELTTSMPASIAASTGIDAPGPGGGRD
jgi:alcohol dehydrogenase class IV